MECQPHRKGHEPVSDQPRRHRRLPAVCDADGCDRAPVARGYCTRHYRQLRRTGSPYHIPRIPGPRPFVPCAFDAERASRHLADGRAVCRSHYDRWRRRGDPLAPLRLRVNAGRVCANGDGRRAARRGLCWGCAKAYYHAQQAANLDIARLPIDK